ncbi:hypothetical protein U1Q18_048315 [Sarracenia purpurea var. burkii]
MVIGAAGISIGTWIKVFSVYPDRFYLALTAQSFQAIFQVLTFSLSARFTAIWFGANEISVAGALGLFGDQLGSALGFLIPPTLVKDGSPEIIGNGLRKMHWYHAGISTAILLVITLFFKSAPKLPPSAAQAKQRQSEKENVPQAIKSIMKKRSFILILLSYGLTLGSIGASYYATGFQMAIEVTFPVSEEISSALLFLSVQFHAFTLTIAVHILSYKLGGTSAAQWRISAAQ